MFSSGKADKRRLSFDLNLVPFIDVLSVCICFLLMTAVFLNLGTMNVHQAVGDQATAEQARSTSLWLKISDDGSVALTLKEKRRHDLHYMIAADQKHISWERAVRAFRGPYEYSVPGATTDFSPQGEK